MRRILIADPNTPFATVVGETLRNLGAFQTELAASGPEALQLCQQAPPHLAVVDVDLPDCQPVELIQQLRALAPGLPVIFIPYSPDEVPPGLEIQGLLTKPFFLPDLPELIAQILGPDPEAQQAPPPAAPAAKPAATRAFPSAARAPAPATARPVPAGPIVLDNTRRALVEGHVQALSHAVRDEPVLLTRGTEVIAVAPRLSQTASAALAQVITRAQTAGGAEVMRFEGDSESARYMLYSVPVAADLVLSVALRIRLQLPTLRRLVREAADAIVEVVGGQ